MKKSIVFMALLTMCVCPKLQAVEFAYDAGAEVVSCYMWRGLYNGGLSLQPDVEIGYDGDLTALRIGAWGNVGATDWRFRTGLPENADGTNPNTYFLPEIDLMINFTVFGVKLGATHYYYFGGSPFFNWGKFDPVNGMPGTSQTEVSIGYDFGSRFEFLPLSLTWNTFVAGDDLIEDQNGNLKRAFSSYFEARFDQPLPLDMTVSLAVGFSPWASNIYGNQGFAVTNIFARFGKIWNLDVCELDLFAQASLNTDNLNRSNVFVRGAGDDKLYQQKLNGCIGLGVWF